MLDRHLRHPDDRSLLYPGRIGVRLNVVDADDHDLVRLRQDTPEGSPGLFIVRRNESGRRAVVEAYYPESIRPAYRASLDPARRQEMDQGRPIIIAFIMHYDGELTAKHTREISRNARNARRHLRRTLDSHSLKREIYNEHDAQTEGVANEFGEHVESAYRDSVEYSKPKVPVGGRSN